MTDPYRYGSGSGMTIRNVVNASDDSHTALGSTPRHRQGPPPKAMVWPATDPNPFEIPGARPQTVAPPPPDSVAGAAPPILDCAGYPRSLWGSTRLLYDIFRTHHPRRDPVADYLAEPTR